MRRNIHYCHTAASPLSRLSDSSWRQCLYNYHTLIWQPEGQCMHQPVVSGGCMQLHFFYLRAGRLLPHAQVPVAHEHQHGVRFPLQQLYMVLPGQQPTAACTQTAPSGLPKDSACEEPLDGPGLAHPSAIVEGLRICDLSPGGSQCPAGPCLASGCHTQEASLLCRVSCMTDGREGHEA